MTRTEWFGVDSKLSRSEVGCAMGYVLVVLMVVAFALIFVGFYEQLETLAFGGAIMLAVVMHRAGRSDARR